MTLCLLQGVNKNSSSIVLSGISLASSRSATGVSCAMAQDKKGLVRSVAYDLSDTPTEYYDSALAHRS